MKRIKRKKECISLQKKIIYPIYNGKYLYINDEKYEEKEVGKGSDVLAKKIGLVGTSICILYICSKWEKIQFFQTLWSSAALYCRFPRLWQIFSQVIPPLPGFSRFVLEKSCSSRHVQVPIDLLCIHFCEG